MKNIFGKEQMRPQTCPAVLPDDNFARLNTRHLRISCSGIARFDEKASTRKSQWSPRRRRHPLHIAPLIVSPITNQIRAEQLFNELALPRNNRTDVKNAVGALVRDNQSRRNGMTKLQRSFDSETICLNKDSSILDIATEDLDTTLREMDHVLHQLNEWKSWRTKTLAASNHKDDSTTGNNVEQEIISLTQEEDSLLQGLKERHRKRQSVHAKFEELLRDSWKHDQIAISRANTALTTSSPAQLHQLEAEVFDLDVEKIKSEKKHQVLWDLEGANESLDFQLVDVEAYSSELDLVLAQFASADLNSS